MNIIIKVMNCTNSRYTRFDTLPPPLYLLLVLCIHLESAQISSASEIREVQVILFKHFKVDSIIIIISYYICTLSKAEMKCPVCRTLQVDPCTLQCGHTICQLCLARMYKNFDKFCPTCKEPWSMFPAISYDYRYIDQSSLCYSVTA